MKTFGFILIGVILGGAAYGSPRPAFQTIDVALAPVSMPSATVTWEADGGVVNTSGLYTAPDQTGSFRIRATAGGQ